MSDRVRQRVHSGVTAPYVANYAACRSEARGETLFTVSENASRLRSCTSFGRLTPLAALSQHFITRRSPPRSTDSASARAAIGLALTTGALHGERDTEIGHERLAIVQQDVLRLDVAVNDILPMRVVKRARHFACDAHGLGDRQLALTLESRALRLAGHERHHVVQQAVRLTTVE